MKAKRFLSLALGALLLAGSLFPLVSCGQSGKKPPEGTYTRMTVDINPSVEFMVDDQNKVVSVTALNDDGSILIAGEAFVGKTPEEATELVVKLATDAGYLVKGEVSVENTASTNEVKISVSGNSEYAGQLRETLKKNVEKLLDDSGITGAVNAVEAKTLEQMRQLVVEDGLFTEDEVKDMTEEQLYRALAAGRIETAELLTREMREAYYRAKEYRIAFAEREETGKIIEGMGAAYTATLAVYKVALNSYSAAIEALDDLRYQLLVSPDSAYQKALAELRDAKEELLKEKKIVASVKVGDENYAEVTASFKLSEENYQKMYDAVVAAGDAANRAMEDAVRLLQAGESALKELESKFPEEITGKLTEEAKNLENAVNSAKDGFFAEFEKAHKDDIKKMENDLKAKKQELIAEAKGEKQ